MILMFIGIIGLIISVLILLIGLIKKSRKLKILGIGIGAVPLFCFILLSIWYGVLKPSSYNNQMKDFAGTYYPHESAIELLKENDLFDKSNRLVLKENGTFEFDSIPGVNLTKIGKWETGGIDGHFNFYDNTGVQINFGMPSGSEENCGLKFHFRENEDDFFEIKELYFIKREMK